VWIGWFALDLRAIAAERSRRSRVCALFTEEGRLHRVIHGHVPGQATGIRGLWDKLHRGVREPLGLVGPALLLPYRKFGTPDLLRVGGRVVEDRGVLTAAHTKSAAENIRLTLKRYGAYEIPGAKVRVQFGAETDTIVTDSRGFFEVEIMPSAPVHPPPGEVWLPVKLSLLDAPGASNRPLDAEAFVLIPGPSARFGIISDIDDTIVKTGATNFLKHWRTVVQNSAEGRVPFRGLAPFYRALVAGAGGSEGNPVFYVSSSPWNLYDLFERYLVLHQIPLGPILLRHIGIGAGRWPGGSHHANKLAQIERVLAAYPHLPFILVGDSGQHDPEIYSEATRLHPGRIAAIYIRDVTGDDRDLAAKGVLEPLKAQGVRWMYGPDLIEAAEDAAAAGWIVASALAEIRAAVANPDQPGA
jgi:phosphatidate phosphatase APP1